MYYALIEKRNHLIENRIDAGFKNESKFSLVDPYLAMYEVLLLHSCYKTKS